MAPRSYFRNLTIICVISKTDIKSNLEQGWSGVVEGRIPIGFYGQGFQFWSNRADIKCGRKVSPYFVMGRDSIFKPYSIIIVL